ncbi:hypothetical protein [Oceanobacillus oncorhynchi]|uniref:hypothetical protein n=1 Tax=Oceanobacillus oncorhynchi TaxID=545501 RepID=UPI0018676D2E|nr:hypothetical protein [Oceanobacillus oncorhynchi]
MAKSETPTYILELELDVNPSQKAWLARRLKNAKAIYNACLGKALKGLKAVLADKNYRIAVKEISRLNKIAEAKRNRFEKASLKELKAYTKWLEKFYDYSEYSLHDFVKSVYKHYHFTSAEAQKLATRAFQAVERVHYRKANKVMFKGREVTISIEGKSDTSALKRVGDSVQFGKEHVFPMIVKKKDTYAEEALLDRTKYVRLLAREIRGKTRYFIQLVQDGYPPVKLERKVSYDKKKRVGLDKGVSTFAIVSEDKVQLRELAPECQFDYRKLRIIQRAMDRSKRATNPDNFQSNGTVKKGNIDKNGKREPLKWHFSKRYGKLKNKWKELHRSVAMKRKQSHEKLANEILALGSDIRVEDMQIQGLTKRAKKTKRNQKNGKIIRKKRYGKTVANHAPAMLVDIIDRKLGYQRCRIKKVNTQKVKASQYNHVTDRYTKKALSARWNEDINGERIQRDLYSAFLIMNTTENMEKVDQALCEKHWEQFVKLHHVAIEEIKMSNNLLLRWYIG